MSPHFLAASISYTVVSHSFFKPLALISFSLKYWHVTHLSSTDIGFYRQLYIFVFESIYQKNKSTSP